MEKYRDWDILEELPSDWIIDKTAGSPAPNTVFITNGKSPLKGQKRALLKIKSSVVKEQEKPKHFVETKKIVDSSENIDVPFPYKTVNDLARLKFKEQLLKEIMFDLMVCEVEGWDKKEYISELKKLLNGINIKAKKETVKNQNDLFSCSNT